MLNVLLSIVLASSASQAAPHTAPQEEPSAATRTLLNEFEDLRCAYAAEVKPYTNERVLAARQKRAPMVGHPAKAYWARMEALGARDVLPALGWMTERAGDAFDDPAQQASAASSAFRRMLALDPNDGVVLSALISLRERVTAIGDEGTLALAAEAEDKSTNPEVRARAMALQAQVVSQFGRAKEPERIARGTELWRAVLLALPATDAGKEAANVLMPRTDAEFVAAQAKWIEAVDGLLRGGDPSAQWPPQPIDTMLRDYLLLAQAGNPLAQRFAFELHPAWKQMSAQGRGLSLAWLSAQIGAIYPTRLEPWARTRVDLLALAIRAHGEERWVVGALDLLIGEVDSYPPHTVQSVVDAVLAHSKDPAARARALWAGALNERTAGEETSEMRALELYDRIANECASEIDIVELARVAARDLRAVMPGKKAPATEVKDQEGLDVRLEGYRGRVVWLFFHGMTEDATLAAFADAKATRTQFEGRPFDLLGMCVEPLAKQGFATMGAERGLDWRCGRLNSRTHPIVAAYQIRRVPTVILVDHEGVIRARNLPLSQMQTLAAQLIAEAEAAQKR